MAEGITRRGDSWRARYRHPETGRQFERSFRRQVDAQRWRRQQLEAAETGRWVDPSRGRVTFGAFFEDWSSRQVWASGTERAMSLAVRSTPFVDMEISKVRHTHVEAWVKEMATGSSQAGRPLAPSTIKTRLANVRSVFRAAIRDELIWRDPTEKVRLPRERKREAAMVIPGPEDVRAILEAAEIRFRAFVAVCAFAGLRLGEAAALQVGDIDFLRRELHVRRQVQRAGGGRVEIRAPKYGSERTIPLPDDVVEILARHVELGLVNEWLFSGAEKDPPHQNTVGHRWRTTCTAAGVAGIRLHDLRHFYASGLIAAGRDVVAVQHALGHSKATTTLNTYSHLWRSSEELTRTAAATISAAVLSPGEGTVRAEVAE